MRTRVLTVILALGVLTAACGDDDAGLAVEEQALVDAIFADMQSDAEPDEEFNAGDMRCFAEGIVDELGVVRLGAVGVTAEDVGDPEAAFRAMTDAEVGAIADRGMNCVDFASAFVDSMVADGVSPGSADCLVRRLEETEFFRQAFIAGMRGEDFDPGTDAELLTAFMTGAGECFTDEEFATVFGG